MKNDSINTPRTVILSLLAMMLFFVASTTSALGAKLGMGHTADGQKWSYEWNANGSLKTVVRPDRKTVSFEYDALGRRTAKIFDERVTRWVWDGNNHLHE